MEQLLHVATQAVTTASVSTLPVIVGVLPHLGHETPTRTPARTRFGFFPGTFNPLTVAHLALADAAISSGCDQVFFCLPLVSVDKEDIDDVVARLAQTARFLAGYAHLTAAVMNVGLYVNIAEAARRFLPGARPVLLCGADKIEQIFDQAYYADPLEQVLSSLFAKADIWASPRSGSILPEHPNVRELSLDPAFLKVSSSEVRDRLAAGLSVDHLVP